MSENIILIGFMGAGKDTIGRLLAQRLHKSFISTDYMIELAEGKTVSEIFEKRGEPYFRRREAWVIKNIKNLKNTVIATGGGMVLYEKNCRILKNMGMVVYLHTELSALKQRIRFDGTRPLIRSAKDLKMLYNKRKGLYDFADVFIDTTEKGIKEIVQDIIEKLRLRNPNNFNKKYKVVVRTGAGQYPVIIGAGILQRLAIKPEDHIRVLVITNPLVGALYLSALRESLEKKGFGVFTKVIPDGENYKTLKIVNEIYRILFDHNFSRADLIIGLGGGVIIDIAGFVASTYKRGMRLINIPTTLLAMVDAGFGGKTGVNTDLGKNMIGTFYQPEMVVCDIKKLASLSDYEFKNGISEVIKYGLIKSKRLTRILQRYKEQILGRRLNILFHIVKECVLIKASIIAQDEKETEGKREILNFGHTIGHIIETLTKYKKYSHGEAIAIGMVEEARMFGKKSNFNTKFIVDLLKNYGLPFSLPAHIGKNSIKKLLFQDKKVRAGNIKVPILVKIGRAIIKDIKLGG